jgi:hypothetical protein
MRIRLVIAIAGLLLAGAPQLFAQARPDTTRGGTGPTHVLKTRQGSTFLGRLIEERGDTIRFETNGGMLTLPRSNVAELRLLRVQDMHDGEYWFPDPNRSRLFFAPTARMLGQGEGYYSNTYVFLQNFAAGLSDNFTLGGGFSVLPTSLNEQVFYAAPKVRLVSQGALDLAAGALLAVVPVDNGHNFGVMYGVGTYGSDDASVTAGIGWGFVDSKLAGRPAVLLGGSARVAQRVALLTENYVLPNIDGPVVLTGGIRFFGEKLSADIAFWTVPGANDLGTHVIPYVAFAVKF